MDGSWRRRGGGTDAAGLAAIPNLRPSPLSTAEARTPIEDLTGYNNFYEFGTEKSDPAANAGTLKTRPWTLVVDGACEAPGAIGIEDILKSIKSIVRISLTATRPVNTWNQMQPEEYGFYANVNPQVDHPRWSQARHRMIGGGLFAPKRETLMFNGYADQVAGLYASPSWGCSTICGCSRRISASR